LVGNAFVYESRNDLFFQPPLGEALFLPLHALFGFDPVRTIVWGSRFVFPALIFFAAYLFFERLFGTRLLACAVSSAVFLASPAVFYPRSFISLIMHGMQEFSVDAFVPYVRPAIPQTSALIFFLFLACFLLLIAARPPRRIIPILCGALYGCALYVYLYNWIFLTCFLGVALLYYLYRRDLIIVRRLLACAATGAVVALPYALITWQVFHSPFFPVTAARYNLHTSHVPVLSMVLMAGFAALIAAYYRGIRERAMMVFAGLLFTGVLVLNQQVITGKVLFYGHFHWYFNTPIALAAVVFALYRLGESFHRSVGRAIGITVIVASLAMGIAVQGASYQARSGAYAVRQAWGPAMQWLENNSGGDEMVILSNNRSFANAVPTFTRHYPYDGLYAHLFLTDPERLAHNMFVYVWLKGVRADGAEEYFLNHREELVELMGAARNRRIYGCDACFPDEIARAYAARYRAFVSGGMQSRLFAYRLDFLVWDKSLQREPLPELLAHADLVHVTGQFLIYRMVPPPLASP
jgi:hypothetical protein